MQVLGTSNPWDQKPENSPWWLLCPFLTMGGLASLHTVAAPCASRRDHSSNWKLWQSSCLGMFCHLRLVLWAAWLPTKCGSQHRYFWCRICITVSELFLSLRVFAVIFWIATPVASHGKKVTCCWIEKWCARGLWVTPALFQGAEKTFSASPFLGSREDLFRRYRQPRKCLHLQLSGMHNNKLGKCSLA